MPEWIAAIVGAFIAGLIGVLANWFAHFLDTRRTRRTLAVALDAELELLDGVFRKAEKVERPIKMMFALATQRPLTSVYSQNLDKVGLLGEENARQLIIAYNTALLWIGKAEETVRELEQVEYEPERKKAVYERLSADAVKNLPEICLWPAETRKVHESLKSLAS